MPDPTDYSYVRLIDREASREARELTPSVAALIGGSKQLRRSMQISYRKQIIRAEPDGRIYVNDVECEGRKDTLANSAATFAVLDANDAQA